MWNSQKVLWFVAVSCLGCAVLIGCARQQKGAGGGDAGQAADDWKTGLDEESVAALSQLSPGDRTAALAQETCPVSDKPLGSMGKPPKVTVEGHDLFLCCEACEAELRSDPSKYLAKLGTQQE